MLITTPCILSLDTNDEDSQRADGGAGGRQERQQEQERQQVELSKLEEVIVQYIPHPAYSVLVPLGDWSRENLKFLCNGKLSVSVCVD